MSEAPIGIGDLFSGGNSCDEESRSNSESEGRFHQQFEIATVEICNNTFKIRQFSFHEANANQIWPGTYRLAEFMTSNSESYVNKKLLELGAATGALSLYLRRLDNRFNICTSDIDDGGLVESNIAYNFELNGKKFISIY